MNTVCLFKMKIVSDEEKVQQVERAFLNYIDGRKERYGADYAKINRTLAQIFSHQMVCVKAKSLKQCSGVMHAGDVEYYWKAYDDIPAEFIGHLSGVELRTKIDGMPFSGTAFAPGCHFKEHDLIRPPNAPLRSQSTRTK